MRTAEYWQGRAELRVNRAQLAADKVIAGIDKKYRSALQEMQAEVQKLVLRYGDQYSLTYAEAQKAIASSEFADWRMTLQEYVERINATGDTELLRELDTLAMRSRVSRYTELETAIKVNMAELRAREETAVRELLGGQYEDTYYRQLYETQTGLGFGKSFSLLTPGDVGEALTYPWSGATFSQRIWGDTQRLSGAIRETVTQGLIQGKSIQHMTKALDDIMGKGRYNAKRLVRTEVAYISEQATLWGYIEAGIDDYEILATLDERTSKTCQEQDGEVYKVKDAMVGVNYPPFHVFCRTTTVAHFNDETLDKGMRAARDEKGGYTLVPSDMKYAEWKEKFVEKPDPFASADNFAKYAKEAWGLEKIDIKTIPYDNIKETIKAMDAFISRYPQLKGFIKEIVESERGIMSCVPIGSEFNGIRISFNPVHFTDIKELEETYAEAVRIGHFPAGTTYTGSGAHELGHALTALVIKSLEPAPSMYVPDWNGEVSAKLIVSQAVKTIKGIMPKALTRDLIADVSAYALTKRSEVIAEAFSDVFANGDEAKLLSRKIVEIVEEVLR